MFEMHEQRWCRPHLYQHSFSRKAKPHRLEIVGKSIVQCSVLCSRALGWQNYCTRVRDTENSSGRALLFLGVLLAGLISCNHCGGFDMNTRDSERKLLTKRVDVKAQSPRHEMLYPPLVCSGAREIITKRRTPGSHQPVREENIASREGK
ncbi:hypothetical protein E2C01_061593 [Portunus trituberculatus]|uniref:Uncharacterized protein n=1 Tax=Portunus trituberculatus TaxID=210409 RepID=A0A5B7HEU2_PORTR|nr:hypothetical protein [Portunus trituberculatus]